MTFNDVLSQTIAMLEQHSRVSFRALKRQFDIDDDYLEDLKEALLYAHPQVVDDGQGLIWSGETSTPPETISFPASTPTSPPVDDQSQEPASYTPQHLAEKILTSRSALEGERKQVTVMFCDLANSTALAERIGPEAMHTLLNRFFELALDDVHRYEGTINQFLGDGFMALFGAPIAHEDHARRGVLAALALQQTLQEHHAELGEPHGVTCQFRMGLNSGIVVVGSIGDNLRMDYSAIGDTTNLASRLQGIAEPGETLVSEPTSRLVQGHVRLEALPPVQVKGKTDPVAVYKAVATLPRRSPLVTLGERALSQFVGRERELAILEELLAQVESGQGQVVGIVAEAGSGKSRLLYEFRQRLQDKQVIYLEGRCLSYGSTIPYHPIVDVVRNNCGITESDRPETMIEKMGIALNEVGMEPKESLPYLLQLLGVNEGTQSIAMLTPEAIRTRTFDTLRQMSIKGSQQRPLIFEIEDLHWIDNTSQDYLASLVESLPGAAIFLLTSYRPGYRPPWIDKSYTTQISLHSLLPQDGLTIVHSALQGATLPDHMEQMILDKAEGNPFFLEELTRAVTEQSDLQADMIVPDTIQGVLSARIDRLPEELKRLLQTASVLGREFSPSLLRAIWKGVSGLEPLLLDLTRLEFVYEHTDVDGPLYVFKHALTQDVAYDSMLITRRQALHLSAAQAIETQYTDRLEEVYNLLAYHYANTTETARAVDYLVLHAEKATANYAHEEATAALREALLHAERLPEAERHPRILDLVLRLANSLYFLGQFGETLDLLSQHQAHLHQVGDTTLSGSFYFWLGHTYSYLGNQEQAAEHAKQAIAMARSCGDDLTMGKASYVLARALLWTSHFPAGLTQSREAVSRLEPTGERWWLGQSYWILGWHHAWMGAFDAALEAESRALAIGELLQEKRLQSYAAWSIGTFHAMRGDGEVAIEACQRGLACSPDPLTNMTSLGFFGYAHLESGEHATAMAHLEEAVQRARHFQYLPMVGWFLAWWGEACLLHGHLEIAYAHASKGLAMSRAIGFRWSVALAQRTLGRIEREQGHHEVAGEHLQDALQTFTTLQSRFDVGRTFLDLASLAHSQGHQDTATTHLSTAYAWFKKLQVPKWIERTEQLAHNCCVTLKEVELEELTEDSL